MSAFTPRHAVVLVLLTVGWGLNWPVMKLGVTHFPPLTFRAASMCLGLPVLGLALLVMRAPCRVPRSEWRELGSLTISNMLIWNVLVILGVQALSSGRAAILGYTMPVFAALLGRALFDQRLAPRQLGGIAAAALGVALLLRHEVGTVTGRPWGALAMLLAAAAWAYGTHRLRRTRITAPTPTIAFWMTAATAVLITALAAVFERDRWHAPDAPAAAAMLYNAVVVYGFAQTAWLFLARTLPPIASTLSVMFIPVLGTFTGALWLGETLHLEDFAAMALIVAAIASVLWPARAADATPASVFPKERT